MKGQVIEFDLLFLWINLASDRPWIARVMGPPRAGYHGHRRETTQELRRRPSLIGYVVEVGDELPGSHRRLDQVESRSNLESGRPPRRTGRRVRSGGRRDRKNATAF